MTNADWNVAVIEMLTEEASTLVYSSQCISKYLSGHNLDWRGLFRQRLSAVFQDLQAVGGSKTIPSELHRALERSSDQKKGGKSNRAALNKVSLYLLI